MSRKSTISVHPLRSVRLSMLTLALRGKRIDKWEVSWQERPLIFFWPNHLIEQVKSEVTFLRDVAHKRWTTGQFNGDPVNLPPSNSSLVFMARQLIWCTRKSPTTRPNNFRGWDFQIINSPWSSKLNNSHTNVTKYFAILPLQLFKLSKI